MQHAPANQVAPERERGSPVVARVNHSPTSLDCSTVMGVAPRESMAHPPFVPVRAVIDRRVR